MIKTLRFAIFAAVALLVSAGCVCSTKSNGATSTLADARSRFAGFGTNKIHYLSVGTGRHTLVLIHCWAGNSRFWREQIPALAGKARLILIDLPGHGQSDKPHTNYTMDFFAGAVLAVMRDAHVDKAALIGHSMGTPVICRVYSQAPEKVSALVAVDGTLRRPQISPEQSEQFIAAFRAPEYRENTRNIMGTMFPIPGTEALRDHVVAELLATPQYVMLSAMEGMFGVDQPDWDVRKVTVPVLVINAPNPMWNGAYREHARSLSTRTDYRTLEGAGHWLMLEKPADFNAALIDMLEKFDLIAR